MKKQILFIMLLAKVVCGAMAQNNAIYIYRNDNEFNAFHKSNIDSIRYSSLDLDSIRHAGNVTQEIWTADTVYRIPLAGIDSLCFVTQPMVNTGDVTPTYTMWGSASNSNNTIYYVIDECGFFYNETGTPRNENASKISCVMSIDGSFNGTLIREILRLTPNIPYYYTAFVRVGDEYYYGETKSFKTDRVTPDPGIDPDPFIVVNHMCPNNRHPHAIDLGLPSGTKWSCCNVGANSPEAYGGYYAWGETFAKSFYSFGNYKYYGKDSQGFPWFLDIGYDIAGTSFDVARIRMGYIWRIPSVGQMNELIQYSSYVLSSWNGVYGLLVTGPNGNRIFLPAAGMGNAKGINNGGSGWYWLSSQYGSWSHCENASMMIFPFTDTEKVKITGTVRIYGLSVRAVCQ